MRSLFAIALVTAAIAAPQLCAAEERFAPLRSDQLGPEQKAWAESIAAPPRNAKFTNPPYRAYIRSPKLAPRLQALSDFVRWESSLPARMSEFAILIAARQWTQQYEWAAHYPLALKGGLDPSVPADLAVGKRPEKMKDDEAVLYDLAMQIYRDKNVTDPVYAAAVDKLGEQGVMEAIAVMGYYDLVSMTLITARAVPRDTGAPILQPLPK
jgi:4-carboxymuconolactone decarboxylase